TIATAPLYNLKNVILDLTLNDKEQIKISNILNNFDTSITLHQRKLEKLKNIKNMLLEKAFI
ncbi:hypothetical protein, partial [Mycoplasma tauri]|uniref:hypothetical protein n=1 Tax=Mycoplasma tauri TaxID=547987 RepID=UPI001EC9C6A1|nr:hypothetical protein [Mycoplasma tauri]